MSVVSIPIENAYKNLTEINWFFDYKYVETEFIYLNLVRSTLSQDEKSCRVRQIFLV